MVAQPALIADGLEFDEAAHAYRLDGKPVPSVTQILEPLHAFDGIPLDVLEAAAERGRKVHAACHLHNVDDLEWSSLDPVIAGYVTGYVKFLRESALQVFLTEKRVASRKYGYAGTLDLFGELNRRRALIDIKSTAAFPRPVGPQTAGYEQGLKETTGDAVQRRYCLLLGRDGTYKLIECAHRQDFTWFLSALNLHRWKLMA